MWGKRRTTLRGDYTAFSESAIKKLEVRLLEQHLGRTLWIRGVCDDDVEFILLVGKKLEPVANMSLDRWVLETNGHAREVLLRESDHGLVQVGSGTGAGTGCIRARSRYTVPHRYRTG